MYLFISSGRLFLLLFLQILGSLVIFAAVIGTLVFMVRGPLRRHKPLDLAVFDRMQHLPNAGRNKFMLFITFLGKHQFLIPANLLLIFYFLLIAKETWLSVRVLAVALSSLVLMFLLKWLFGRKRPLSPLLQAAKGLSFPSGHAIMSVSFFGLIIYWVLHSVEPLWLAVSLIVLLVMVILLIGFSRIYLRVHYTSDVIAGLLIGLVWMLIALFVVAQVEQLSIVNYLQQLFDYWYV